MLVKIKNIDTELLIYLNNLGSENWDGFWLFMTYTITSIPVYLVILFLVYKYFGIKKLAISLLFIIIVITISDQTSNLFKYGFERLRPCFNEDVKGLIRLVKSNCGGRFSFFSAHASTSLAVAVFFGMLLRKHVKYVSLFIIVWALFVGYSRIYIGVHFPFDVLFGFAFGGTIGYLFYKLLLIFYERYAKS
jgi:undecaprenyl-diphosphatase